MKGHISISRSLTFWSSTQPQKRLSIIILCTYQFTSCNLTNFRPIYSVNHLTRLRFWIIYRNFSIHLNFTKTNKIWRIKHHTDTTHFSYCLNDKIKVYCTEFKAEYIHGTEEHLKGRNFWGNFIWRIIL